jgi:hypothetical protein
MAAIRGTGPTALERRFDVSASTALQLYKLATSSPVNQRVGFEHYADDRLADATLRHKIYIAAADEKPLGAQQKQLFSLLFTDFWRGGGVG